MCSVVELKILCIKTGRDLRLFCPAAYLINKEPEVIEQVNDLLGLIKNGN